MVDINARVIYWIALLTKISLVLTCVLLVDAFRRIKRLKLKDLIVSKQTILIHSVAFFAFLASAFVLYAIPITANISGALIVGAVSYVLSFINYSILIFILHGMSAWQRNYIRTQD